MSTPDSPDSESAEDGVVLPDIDYALNEFIEALKQCLDEEDRCLIMDRCAKVIKAAVGDDPEGVGPIIVAGALALALWSVCQGSSEPLKGALN
jgi:hypothetical protein